MRIINPGGSGGSGTVTTDGVTIQGDGSGGNPIAIKNAESDGVTLQGQGTAASKLAIKAVQTDASLTGAGTGASPLGLSPVTFWMGENYPLANFGVAWGANTLGGYGIVIPMAVTFANLSFQVATADNVNNNDVGLYLPSGVLVCNIGAQHIATTGSKTIATLQGSQTIKPGMYVLAWTSVGATFALVTSSPNGYSWCGASNGSSAGGALPSPSPAWASGLNSNTVPFALS